MAGACAAFFVVSTAHATASFSDVSPNNTDYNAIMYLAEQGMVKGYADGTFKPGAPVDRAAAVKMMLGGLVTEEEAEAVAASAPHYDDMPQDAWYRGWVARGVARGFIDGPDKKSSFNGSKQVILAEALKMLEIAQGMDPNAYSEIRMPLANDVTDPAIWFYPYVRAGLAASIIMVREDGVIRPDMTLTRGDVATLVYRALMYKQNRRTQALLTVAETELSGNVLQNLTPEGLSIAKMAYARALLAARGALTSRPDTAIVKGAVKITEGFGALVTAYDAGIAGQFDAVLIATGEAWSLANEAIAFSQELSDIATNMQRIAHNMAEDVRALKSGGG